MCCINGVNGFYETVHDTMFRLQELDYLIEQLRNFPAASEDSALLVELKEDREKTKQTLDLLLDNIPTGSNNYAGHYS